MDHGGCQRFHLEAYTHAEHSPSFIGASAKWYISGGARNGAGLRDSDESDRRDHSEK
jgi:hypothetical protein